MKAMIFAAGRGERMRPLSDHAPKPLLEVGGKPLIVWQIERLVRAGFADIVINHAHLGYMIEERLGSGGTLGARIRYSPEVEALETAGGIAKALHLLGNEPFIALSGDIYTDFDYATLRPRIAHIAAHPEQAIAHFVLTDNPRYNIEGDMGLRDGLVTLTPPKLNYGNIGVLHPRLFEGIQPGAKAKLFPPMFDYVQAGKVTGEHFQGSWFNIGTPEHLAELDSLLRANARS
ncbi:MAG: nucleotidyltransferase family protein [Pseudomonadota bacterium]